jgi:hypothetical protein
MRPWQFRIGLPVFPALLAGFLLLFYVVEKPSNDSGITILVSTAFAAMSIIARGTANYVSTLEERITKLESGR